jgi:hypothetical protein
MYGISLAFRTWLARLYGMARPLGEVGVRVEIRVMAEERELWVAAAQEEGVSLSEWIRQRCALTEGVESAGSTVTVTEKDPVGDSGGSRPTGVPAPSVERAGRVFRPDAKPTIGKKAKEEKKAKVEPAVPTTCPRWTSHRKGTVCKFCGWMC